MVTMLVMVLIVLGVIMFVMLMVVAMSLVALMSYRVGDADVRAFGVKWDYG